MAISIFASKGELNRKILLLRVFFVGYSCMNILNTLISHNPSMFEVTMAIRRVVNYVSDNYNVAAG